MSLIANQAKYGPINEVNFTMKSWLQDNDIETYSTHEERKSVVTKRFIRTLRNIMYKYMTSVWKKFVYR